jgi:pilus assembly protein CpaE
VGLEVGDVETAIGMPVDAALPSSRLVPLSMNHGHAVVLDEPDSNVAQRIVGFAQRFTPRPDDPIRLPGERKPAFSLRRR